MSTRSSRLVIAVLMIGSASRSSMAAAQKRPTVSAKQGTVVRWGAPGTRRCGMWGRSWPALEEVCYYPIDLLQKPAVIPVARWVGRRRETARISVEAYEYGSENIELPDIPQAHPSPEDRQRNTRDQALVSRVWKRREGPARFTLPLGAPANPLPKPKTFGYVRTFNGEPAVQPHMGADYALTTGTPVLAVADGKVAIAEDLFYAGNAVFIDHGDGLISMAFHLSEIQVQPGQQVRRGELIGLIGSTGRATGPHLFFAIRWHSSRIDPEWLLDDPGKIPSLD
jgi:peptidase M23-like protein